MVSGFGFWGSGFLVGLLILVLEVDSQLRRWVVGFWCLANEEVTEAVIHHAGRLDIRHPRNSHKCMLDVSGRYSTMSNVSLLLTKHSLRWSLCIC